MAPEIEDRLFGAELADPERTSRARNDAARWFRRAVHGALRGAIAAMAMTGLRDFTRQIGLQGEPPPEAIARQKLLGGFRSVKRGPRRAQVELAHWSYGAAAGALFAALPHVVRRSRWSGPVYGLLVWGSFELAFAPLLSLSQAKRAHPLDRLALAADHLLYGFLLSEDAALRSARTPLKFTGERTQ